MKMNLTILTPYFHPEQFIINPLAVELQNRGHEVTIQTGLPNYPKGEFFSGYSFWKGPFFENYHGVSIYRTPIIPRGKGFFQLSWNYLSFVISATLTMWRTPKPDVYFVYAPSPITSAIPAIIYRFFSGRPVVIWLQDLWPESLSAVGVFQKTSLIYKAVERLVHWIYRHTDLMLIQSPRFQENLKTYGFPIEKSIWIPNWAEDIPKTEYQPAWLSELPKNKFIVTFAGNIGIAQAVDTIFHSALLLKDHSEIAFVIVGDGRELERLKKMTSDLQLQNLHFYGRKPFTDMAALFEQSDALLVSLKNDDIFLKTIPAKAVQYLSAKKPIISSAGGMTNELIMNAKAGVVSQPENPQELTEAVLKLFRISHEERKKMGECAYEYYLQNFKKELVIDHIEKALRKVTNF